MADFDLNDMSLEALLDRNREVFARIRNPRRDFQIDCYAFLYPDGETLIRHGYLSSPHYTTNYVLTDMGVDLVHSLRAKAGGPR